MLYAISDTDLNLLCNYLTITPYIYYPVTANYYTDLWNTGCRPMEVLTPGLWTYTSPTDITLAPLKGNSTRFFTSSDLSADLLFAIINNVKPYQGLSLRQIEYVTKKILPTPQVQTIDKSAVSYLFRYNYIKQLAIHGMSDADIAARMGQSSSTIAAGYRTANLYSTSPLPPLPPIMNYPYRLKTFTTNVSNTSSSFTIVNAYTLPANTLNRDGDTLFVRLMVKTSTTSGTNEIDPFWNLSPLFGIGPSAIRDIVIEINFIRKSSSILQYSWQYVIDNGTTSCDINEFTSQDFTISNDINIKVRGNIAGAITVNIETIDFIPAEP